MIMTTEIQKTQTSESQALENAMSGKVHDIPSPGKLLVNVDIKGGRKFLFNINNASEAMALLTLLKENQSVTITHRKDWQ